jgi:Holliday junction resolvase RusA-like endonuclease
MNAPRSFIIAGLSERSKKSARTRARVAEARKPTGAERSEPVSFTVEGKPKGKGRARVTINGTYTPAATVAYERQIKSAARIAMENCQPFTGPVEVEVIAWFPIPVSWPKYRQAAAAAGTILPTIKPDGDNILKLAMDACNRTAWGDDAQVVKGTISKRYGASKLDVFIKPAHPGEPLDATKPTRGDQAHSDHRPQDSTSSSSKAA